MQKINPLFCLFIIDSSYLHANWEGVVGVELESVLGVATLFGFWDVGFGGIT